MRLTFFQFFTISIFTLFMGMLLFVSVTAFSRTSGTKGLSMAKIQKIRSEVALKKK